MGKCTFKGGIHPFDGKELSKDKPIKGIIPCPRRDGFSAFTAHWSTPMPNLL